MKKFYFLFGALICFCTANVFAASPCDSEISNGQHSTSKCERGIEKTPITNCQKPCEVTQRPVSCSDNFLCTCKNMEKLFNCIGLSETQKCNAMKIQEKYELEVLSLNEQITCEENKLCSLKKGCSSNKEIKKSKKRIKNLKKERKRICKCYEKQFKSLMSDMQIKKYKKAIKK